MMIMSQYGLLIAFTLCNAQKMFEKQTSVITLPGREWNTACSTDLMFPFSDAVFSFE
jgi:hypothetical protein